jgi:hypothetical protein
VELGHRLISTCEAQWSLDPVASRHESKPFVWDTILGIPVMAMHLLDGSGPEARALLDRLMIHGRRPLNREKAMTSKTYVNSPSA